MCNKKKGINCILLMMKKEFLKWYEKFPVYIEEYDRRIGNGGI